MVTFFHVLEHLDRPEAYLRKAFELLEVAGMAMGFMADGGPALPNMPMDGMGRVMGQGDGSGIDDKVPALLSTGEYVIPADAVKVTGTEFFDRMVEKIHTPAAEQRKGALPMGGR